MRKHARQPGFALLLVLILVAMGVIMGMAYLSTASTYRVSATRYGEMARARYLAESAAQHAMCLLRERPDLVNTAPGTTLGPFTVDGTGTYTFSFSDGLQANQYVINCQASNRNSTQSCQVTVQKPPGGPTVEQALLVGAGVVIVPSRVTINGPVHVNGVLTNFGKITIGPTTATGQITNLGSINPDARHGNVVNLPTFLTSSYYSYVYHGKAGTAYFTGDTKMAENDSYLRNGTNVTADNAAGVVVIRPAKNASVTISSSVNFTGTMIVEGNLTFDGDNISLTPKDGYPALIVTGKLAIKGNSKVTINGLVSCPTGLTGPQSGWSSMVKINGALVANMVGLGMGLSGTHTVTYDQAKVSLVDPATGQGGGDQPLTLLGWDG